jgi:hypothetical protein
VGIGHTAIVPGRRKFRFRDLRRTGRRGGVRKSGTPDLWEAGRRTANRPTQPRRSWKRPAEKLYSCAGQVRLIVSGFVDRRTSIEGEPEMLRTRTAALVLAGMLMSPALSACRFRERVCSVGEYPARSIAYPKTGGVCVRNGQRPPAGYETYPAGKTPTYVDQQHS